jgi:hypothetical protein
MCCCVAIAGAVAGPIGVIWRMGVVVSAVSVGLVTVVVIVVTVVTGTVLG